MIWGDSLDKGINFTLLTNDERRMVKKAQISGVAHSSTVYRLLSSGKVSTKL